MKKEDLFPGAIVLSRISGSKKRSRHEVVEVFSTSVKLKVNDKDNSFFFASLAHIRPAKITRKALKEIGFEERETICHRKVKPVCIEYIYPTEAEWPWRPKIILKDECDQWGPTRMFGGFGIHKVSYIHEVQRIISNQQNQK